MNENIIELKPEDKWSAHRCESNAGFTMSFPVGTPCDWCGYVDGVRKRERSLRQGHNAEVIKLSSSRT